MTSSSSDRLFSNFTGNIEDSEVDLWDAAFRKGGALLSGGSDLLKRPDFVISGLLLTIVRSLIQHFSVTEIPLPVWSGTGGSGRLLGVVHVMTLDSETFSSNFGRSTGEVLRGMFRGGNRGTVGNSCCRVSMVSVGSFDWTASMVSGFLVVSTILKDGIRDTRADVSIYS